MMSYIRYELNNGNIHYILLLSQSRVTPLKIITISRLELTAAWTDSISTLRYIANEISRFRALVANRVSLIREFRTISQWRYVPSKYNRIDLASRCSTADNLLQDEWMKGPEFYGHLNGSGLKLL